ncbi:MAG: orotidine-5'-phosphate decarboxylase, partial [Methanomicrobiales archaeon]|nr:orotidine-5'-phosphate decarboxylase [Methanomicrobiales archaeon]
MADLILSLDVGDGSRALAIARACAPYVDAIKVGYPLVLSAGLSIAGDLKPLGLPLIADFKVADIPNTNGMICNLAFQAGFSAVIAHAFPGGDSLSGCVEVARRNGGACYAVAEMSHPGAAEFFHGGVAERLAA